MVGAGEAGTGVLSWSTGLIMFGREYFPYWITWFLICVLAYLTNPTSASFRTHLTSLSFHTHLRRLSTPTTAPPNDSHTPHIATGSERRPKSTATIRSPGHVLSFSNRISLSVLTPPYTLRSYGFFSTVLMSTSAKKSYTVVEVVGGQEKRTVVERPVEGVWIGVFGGWYRWKRNGDITMEEEDRKERLQSGVAAMEAEDEVEEDDHDHSSSTTSIEVSTTPPKVPVLRPTNRLRNGRRGFKAGSTPPLTFAQLRTLAASQQLLHSRTNPPAPPPPPIPPPIPKPTPALVHSPARPTRSKPSDHSPQQSTQISIPGGFVMHDSAPPSSSSLISRQFQHLQHQQLDSLDGRTSLLATLSSSTPDPVVDELKIQVEELHLATEEMEKRLQAELEVLRERKRDEDAVRGEGKARTKVLEEAKRVAELARVEAERQLGERKAVTRTIGERVERIEDEMRQMDRRQQEMVERKEKKKRDKKERERKLKDDVQRKQDELREAQRSMVTLVGEVNELELMADERRESVQFKRNELTMKGIHLYGQPSPPPGFLPHHVSHQQQQHHLHMLQQSSSSRPTSLRGRSNSTSSSVYALALDDSTELHHGLTTYYPIPHSAPLVNYPPGFPPLTSHPSIESNSTVTSASVNLKPTTKFLPFDFDYYDGSPGPIEPVSSFETKLSLHTANYPSDTHEGLVDDDDDAVGQDMLSPVTPHQASLIPSQLFELLDGDDEDEDERVISPSPTPQVQSNRRSSMDMLSGEWRTGSETMNGNRAVTADEELQQESPISDYHLAQEHHSSLAHSLSLLTSNPTLSTSSSTDWTTKDELLLSPTSFNKTFSTLSTVFIPPPPSSTPSTPQIADDLPRHGMGLSLNPDAKSFQFASLLSRPTAAAITTTTTSSTSSSSPTTTASSPSPSPSPVSSTSSDSPRSSSVVLTHDVGGSFSTSGSRRMVGVSDTLPVVRSRMDFAVLPVMLPHVVNASTPSTTTPTEVPVDVVITKGGSGRALSDWMKGRGRKEKEKDGAIAIKNRFNPFDD